MLITTQDSQHSVSEQVESFLLGGGKLVQYRAKSVSREKLFSQAQHLQSLCDDFGARLIINDFVGVAQRLGNAGVHLGREDTSPTEAREVLGENVLIGGTVHNPEELMAAAKEPIDYIGLGPFRFTQTKRNLPSAHGIEGMRDLVDLARREGISIPFFAIGGIEDYDVRDLLGIGCYGVAVSASIALASDPMRATQRFLERIKRNAK